MSERTLKPCPFCGLEPRVSVKKGESLWSHDIVDWTHVECTKCDVQMLTCDGVEMDAIDAWNKRDDEALTTATALAERAERLVADQRDLLGAMKAERDEARAWFLACAEAIGVVYEADGCATAPGPVETVVAYIRDANRRSMEHIDCESSMRERDEARGLLREAYDSVAECVNLPACSDPDEPMERSKWCQFCDISARIAAHLEGR